MTTSIERFSTTMRPGLVEILSRSGPINVLELQISGPRNTIGIFLDTDHDGWFHHPDLAEIASGMTQRGIDWLTGAVAAKPVSAKKNGDQLVIGAYNGAFPLAGNSAAPKIAFNSALIAAAIERAAFNPAWCRARAVAAIDPNASADDYRHRLDYNHPDWILLDNYLRSFMAVLGVKVLPDLKSYAVNKPASGSTTKPPFGLYFRAGVRYVLFDVSISTVSSSVVTVYLPVLDTGEEGSVAFYYSAPQSGLGLKAFTSGDPLYGSSVWHSGFSKTEFLDVPDYYKTDAFGRMTVEEDIPDLYSPNAILPDAFKKALKSVNRITLLPLVAPTGDATFFVRGPAANITTTTRQELVEVFRDGSEVAEEVIINVTTLQMPATDMLSSIPNSWYNSYLSSGFGYFKGMGPVEAQKLADKMMDLSTYSHTAVFTHEPITVPKDIVTKLDLYLEYKKAREKACLSNDFFELSYDGKQTWGEVNQICNKVSSVSVLYGVSDTNPSLNFPYAAPVANTISYGVITTSSPWGVFTQNAGEEPVFVTEEERASVFVNVYYGATLGGGVTVNSLATNWGYDYPTIAAELANGSGEASGLKTMSDPVWRGRGTAAGDFAWENIGISGFPLYREMALQDGLKAIIFSLATVKGRTEPLHRAFLSFGEKAFVGDLLAK